MIIDFGLSATNLIMQTTTRTHVDPKGDLAKRLGILPVAPPRVLRHMWRTVVCWQMKQQPRGVAVAAALRQIEALWQSQTK